MSARGGITSLRKGTVFRASAQEELCLGMARGQIRKNIPSCVFGYYSTWCMLYSTLSVLCFSCVSLNHLFS